MRLLADYLLALRESPVGGAATLETAWESDIGHIAYARATFDGLAVVIYADRGPLVTGIAYEGAPDYLSLTCQFLVTLPSVRDGYAEESGSSDSGEMVAFKHALRNVATIRPLVVHRSEFARLLEQQKAWFASEWRQPRR